MKRCQLILIFVISIALIPLVPSASAAIKLGASCKKVGQSTTDSGKNYQCVKSGKKLIWSDKPPIGDSIPQNEGDPKGQIFAWPSPDAKYITAVPVDLNQINSISKYASCSGHNRDGYTFDKIQVSNLSLKHYWYPVAAFQGTLDKVKVFAPFNGTVSTIQLEADKKGLGRPEEWKWFKSLYFNRYKCHFFIWSHLFCKESENWRFCKGRRVVGLCSIV